jgi:alanine-synthesizing transaminase
MFSRRTALDVTKNALARALDLARSRGTEVLDLTESNPTRAKIPYAEDEILRSLSDRSALVYEPAPFGLASAREAVAEDLATRGTKLDPSRIVLTASTSEAYAFLFKLLCDPGDEVLAPRPSYPLFEHLAAFESVLLSTYRLVYDGAWHADLESARRAVRPRTRALMVVNPNNPTGSYVARAELDELARTGLPIVSDEVFAGYELDVGPGRATSALALQDHLVFVLGGLSKMALLPQMKVAWICVGGPDRLAQGALERLELIADSFLSVATPQQRALPTLLRTRRRAEEAVLQRTRRNLAALRRAAAGSPVTVLRAEGGWYACLRLPNTETEEAWALGLLAGGVYAHPGHFFDFVDEPVLVVSLLVEEAIFDEGVRRLVAHASA